VSSKKHRSKEWKAEAERVTECGRQSACKRFRQFTRPAFMEVEDCLANAALAMIEWSDKYLDEDGNYTGQDGDEGQVEAHARKRAACRTINWLKDEGEALRLRQVPNGLDRRRTVHTLDPDWWEVVGVDGVEALLRREDSEAAGLFRMHLVNQNSYPEIAALTGSSLDKVKKIGVRLRKLLNDFSEVYRGHGVAAKVDLELARGAVPPAADRNGAGPVHERRERSPQAAEAARHQGGLHPPDPLNPESEQLLAREEWLATPISDAEVKEVNRLHYVLNWCLDDLAMHFGTDTEVIASLLTPPPHSIKPDGMRCDSMGRPGVGIGSFIALLPSKRKKKGRKTADDGRGQNTFLEEDARPCRPYRQWSHLQDIFNFVYKDMARLGIRPGASIKGRLADPHTGATWGVKGWPMHVTEVSE
jgi:hypothetical protein